MIELNGTSGLARIPRLAGIRAGTSRLSWTGPRMRYSSPDPHGQAPAPDRYQDSLHARRVAARLRRARDLQVGAGIEMVKFWYEYRNRFGEAIAPPKARAKRPTWDFEGNEMPNASDSRRARFVDRAPPGRLDSPPAVPVLALGSGRPGGSWQRPRGTLPGAARAAARPPRWPVSRWARSSSPPPPGRHAAPAVLLRIHSAATAAAAGGWLCLAIVTGLHSRITDYLMALAGATVCLTWNLAASTTRPPPTPLLRPGSRTCSRAPQTPPD